ncbi:MAG: hypothetical protein AAGG51_28920 [Cyanobacteria bacterium P01_G01_bin.54]
MKLILASLGVRLLWWVGGGWPVVAQLLPQGLNGTIRITLEDGLWKPTPEGVSYQDLTLDLVCRNNRCDRHIWGYAPGFNQADHLGTVTVIPRGDRAWQLQVQLDLAPDPWRPQTGTAQYQIELEQTQGQWSGTYSGIVDLLEIDADTVNAQAVAGHLSRVSREPLPRSLPGHRPIAPGEHPRLIVRRQDRAALRRKIATSDGKRILKRLQETLNTQPNYGGYAPNGGYYAAGYCFLSFLNEDVQAAAQGWQIVQQAISQPGPRLLEQSPIVAGVALAYDLCYPAWTVEQRKSVTTWLAQETAILIAGTSDRGWNPHPISNWNARARGAAGLATLAILGEPADSLPADVDTETLGRWLKIAERNVQRFLTLGLGDRAFGSEGDHYTVEPMRFCVLPFLQAHKNVLGQDILQGSGGEWLLPQYLMRAIVVESQPTIPTYGRHRSSFSPALLPVGLHTVPHELLPGVLWVLNQQFGQPHNPTFGIEWPSDAVSLLAAYPESPEPVEPQNPVQVWGRVLVDGQKGFYLFRDRWQDSQDFVASLYAKHEVFRSSWSFPEAGSFRIWGLGGRWAAAGPSENRRESENVVVLPGIPAEGEAQTTAFASQANGSGVVSLQMDNVYRTRRNPPVGVRSLRSFAVDYSGASGAPGLFVVVDQFEANNLETVWTMHTAEAVTQIDEHRFTLQSAVGTTLQGTFIAPSAVQITVEPTERGHKILATGDNAFFVVMTVQARQAPTLEIVGTGLNSRVSVGQQQITFQEGRIVLAK